MPVWAGGRQNGRMRLALVDQLEDFIRLGALWDGPQRIAMIASLDQEAAERGDAIAGMLTQSLRSVSLRAQMREVPSRTARDVEGIVYPRIWKIMEAVRDEMPDGELRIRIEVFNRRLARCFAAEYDAAENRRAE
jgi:hypothetical protein